MSNDDMPDEHERINKVRNERSGGASLNHGSVIPNNEPSIGVAPLEKAAEDAKKVLVCDECSEWYDYSEDWGSCPKCETELTEVDKA